MCICVYMCLCASMLCIDQPTCVHAHSTHRHVHKKQNEWGKKKMELITLRRSNGPITTLTLQLGVGTAVAGSSREKSVSWMVVGLEGMNISLHSVVIKALNLRNTFNRCHTSGITCKERIHSDHYTCAKLEAHNGLAWRVIQCQTCIA